PHRQDVPTHAVANRRKTVPPLARCRRPREPGARHLPDAGPATDCAERRRSRPQSARALGAFAYGRTYCRAGPVQHSRRPRMRAGGWMWGALAIGVGVSMYLVKYKVQALEDELNVKREQIAHDRAAIRVLEAEWTYLNDPGRLRRLSAQY